MTKILRDISSAKSQNYDAIIIGGGFYGVMLAYESSSRGLKTLLLEKNDFGSATSFNSLRIVHGGLRYLQTLDLHRFKESVAERKWFMRNFPNLAKPISCLMPLYNKGLQRNSIMWAALNLNDILSATRNKSVNPDNNLLGGKVVSAERVKELFPSVYDIELKGGAIWSDGAIDDSQIVLIEILKKAAQFGCTPLNYVKVKDIILQENQVHGVVAVDQESSEEIEFTSKIVINSTGPWSRSLAEQFHHDFDNLFQYSIAWNILFDVDAISEHALAITPPKDNAKAYFLRPWKGKLFAGTVHETWKNVEDTPIPSESSVLSFIDDLNLSIPSLNLSKDNIVQIYSGLLPAKEEGTNQLAVREVIINHGQQDGPQGLYSLSGVKLTTSRLVAEKVIEQIFGRNGEISKRNLEFDNKSIEEYGVFDIDWHYTTDENFNEILRSKIKNESVVHLQDLIVRRTTLGDNPHRALMYAKEIARLFDWNESKTNYEIEDLEKYYEKRGLTNIHKIKVT